MESKLIPNWNNHISEIPQNLLKDVLDQLIRDLNKAGIDQLEESNMLKLSQIDVDELFNVLQGFLTRLHKENEEKWWNILYIVDLPEIVMRRLIQEGVEQKMNELAKLLLIREWQKVELRRRFSQ